MESTLPLELASLLDHADSDAVIAAVKSLFSVAYPGADFASVEHAFTLINDLYAGRYPGYVACRTAYHDYRHTVDVFVATARLLDGAVLSGTAPASPMAADTLVAALLHDVGYVQETTDAEGTGAKYTKTHVSRSVEFTAKHATAFGLDAGRAKRIGTLILGTDLAIPWDKLPYETAEDRLAASVLAAADLLGQMADRTYLEKLLFLYYEFREAGFGGYNSAFDILRKTSAFYAGTKERLDKTLAPVSYAARRHFAERYGEDRDLYRDAIAMQMSYLDSIMEDDSVNFRQRLRRMDLETIEIEEKARLASFGVSFVLDAS